MSKPIALIVAGNADRKRYLEQRCESAGMVPIGYPNPGAHVVDLNARGPRALVADLSFDAEAVLVTVAEAISQYPTLKVITIGEREFLEREKIFDGVTNVAMCDRIDELAV